MTVNRKEFLALAATGVAAATAWSPDRLLAESDRGVAQSFYSADMFRPYIGQVFHVRSAENARATDDLDVTLQSVLDRTSSPETVQFSLEFMGPAGDPIPSRAYLFVHEKLGSLPIFVSPARKDSEGRTWYRADFNILQNERSTPIAPPRRRR